MICKQCGKNIENDAKFCIHCGMHINGQPTAQQPCLPLQLPSTAEHIQRTIKRNDGWFKFFVWLPTVLAIFWAACGLIAGAILTAVFGEPFYMLFVLVGCIMGGIVYVYEKISLSYKILHIYYLKKISHKGVYYTDYYY